MGGASERTLASLERAATLSELTRRRIADSTALLRSAREKLDRLSTPPRGESMACNCSRKVLHSAAEGPCSRVALQHDLTHWKTVYDRLAESEPLSQLFFHRDSCNT